MATAQRAAPAKRGRPGPRGLDGGRRLITRGDFAGRGPPRSRSRPSAGRFRRVTGDSRRSRGGPAAGREYHGRATRACAAVQERSRGPGNLRVTESDHGDASQLPGGVLSVVVAVVDGRAPRVASTMRATMTVLGVASGAVTAQQLTRVAASAAADGRDIAGILVADPDPADQTTGLLPQLARTGEHRMPTRMSGAVTEVLQ